MKVRIPKIRLLSSIGIYLGENEIAWCVLEKGMLGARQTQCGVEPCSKVERAIALNKLLEKMRQDLGETASVIIGLSPNQVYFATLPAGTKNESAEVLLAGNHCCSSIPASDLIADMLPVKLAGKSYAAISASRKKELQILTDVPRKLGFRFIRVEPGPWALLRSASSNKAGRIALRLFVEESQMIAVLCCGPQPLLWRSLELPAQDATEAIVSLVRSFESYASNHLRVSAIEAFVMEGAHSAELAEKVRTDLGERFSAVKGTGPSLAAIAKGLARGGMQRDKPAPDLARQLAPPPQLRDLIPRGEVAMLLAAVICMGLWLWGAGTVAINKALRVEEGNARNPVLKVDDTKLKSEKKALTAEVQAVTSFIENRILWTEYLGQISGRTPKSVAMVEFQGEFGLTAGMKANEKKTEPHVTLGFELMLPRNVPAPPEVKDLLEQVRSMPVIARDFPEVELTMLRVNKNTESRKKVLGDPSNFTITCLPKAKAPKGGGGAPVANNAEASTRNE